MTEGRTAQKIGAVVWQQVATLEGGLCTIQESHYSAAYLHYKNIASWYIYKTGLK